MCSGLYQLVSLCGLNQLAGGFYGPFMSEFHLDLLWIIHSLG